MSSLGLPLGEAGGTDSTGRRGAAVIQDSQSCLPLSGQLRDRDLILLLTPGVVPDVSPLNHAPQEPPTDPFEPLGKALARHHPWVRHVPYLPRNGITGTHVVHIRLASTVVFVISGPPRHGQVSQVTIAEITRSLCEHRPQIIVACCDIRELGPIEKSFPTIIQLPSFAPSDMEAAAEAIFRPPKRHSTTGPNVQDLILSPSTWPVEVWDGNRDMSATFDLWCQCLPKIFHLSRYQLESLLRRDGYAMHYVVREPGTSLVLGFCATYTTYADSGGDHLIGSMAALLVRPSYRQRGIGLSLHNHALRQLTKTRGVRRLQLGSTFPRLLYGLPLDMHPEDWFRRRGWPIKPRSTTSSETGQEVCDWFLDFKDWPATGLMPSGLTFRPCDFSEFDLVLGFVDKESRGKENAGWYDQYAKLANTMNIRDIVIGLEEGAIVATALTYSRNASSPAAEDLPWASTIADDVGGVTCVCISEEKANIANKRDAIMIRLLDSCIRVLAEQGMKKLVIDAVKGGDEGFQSMGFQKWARYKDVWRDV